MLWGEEKKKPKTMRNWSLYTPKTRSIKRSLTAVFTLRTVSSCRHNIVPFAQFVLEPWIQEPGPKFASDTFSYPWIKPLTLMDNVFPPGFFTMQALYT